MRRRTFLLAAGAAAFTSGRTEAVASVPGPSPSLATLLETRLEQALFEPEPSPLVPTGDLPRLLRHARSDYQATRYLDLTHRLSQAVASAENAVADDPCATHQALLAETYNAASRMLCKLPTTGTEWITTDRALRAARLADNPLLLAETERIKAVAYRRSGAYDMALDLLAGVADRLATAGDHLQGTIAIETLCSASYAAAKNGDRDAAYEFLDEAATLCGHVRNNHEHWQAADPLTNIDVYRVSVGTALHDPDTSLRAVRAVSLKTLPTTERQARFLVDASAARLAADQPDLAARALLLANRLAPQEVPVRATAKAVAATLRLLRPSISATLNAAGL